MADMNVVMTLLVPAKVLCNVWSYDFEDMTLCHWITASSYEKSKFKDGKVHFINSGMKRLTHNYIVVNS